MPLLLSAAPRRLSFAHRLASLREMATRDVRRFIPLVIIVLGSLPACRAASAFFHMHQHGSKADSSERTQDGAFSPRDAGHYTEGEHHQEFDHEAILGTNDT